MNYHIEGHTWKANEYSVKTLPRPPLGFLLTKEKGLTQRTQGALLLEHTHTLYFCSLSPKFKGSPGDKQPGEQQAVAAHRGLPHESTSKAPSFSNFPVS